VFVRPKGPTLAVLTSGSLFGENALGCNPDVVSGTGAALEHLWGTRQHLYNNALYTQSRSCIWSILSLLRLCF
jgi:hypothetical protein